MSAEIKTLGSKTVYANRWMTVREDAIERPSGHRGIYGVVEKADFAVIAAVQDRQMYLVEQYRYPVAGRYWELPQGSWESSAQIEPEEHGLITQPFTVSDVEQMILAGEIKDATTVAAFGLLKMKALI